MTTQLTLALSSASLWGIGIGPTMDLAACAGYQGVELVVDPEVVARGSAWLLGRAHRAGVSITSLHPFPYELPGRLGQFTSPAALVRLAADVGCPLVTVHPPAIRDRRATRWKAWLDAMTLAQELAEGSGVRLALENPPVFGRGDQAKVLARIDDLAEFCELRGLHVTFDTSHAWSAGEDVVAACRRVLGRVVNVHLSDVRVPQRWLDRPLLDSIFKHHQLPGDGTLPLDELLGILLEHGYGGLLTLELSPMALGWPLRRRMVQRLTAAAGRIRERTSAWESRVPCGRQEAPWSAGRERRAGSRRAKLRRRLRRSGGATRPGPGAWR